MNRAPFDLLWEISPAAKAFYLLIFSHRNCSYPRIEILISLPTMAKDKQYLRLRSYTPTSVK